MADQMVVVATPVCIWCMQDGTIQMTATHFSAGASRYAHGAHIQDAFPYLSADEREQLLSGTHPSCWDAMFADAE